MVSWLGDYNTTETVHIPFNTFSSNDPSASVTVTDLAAGDIEIHKDGSTTQRASDAGVTVSIDFDGITGNHMVHIDLSDNTDAGFYAAGSRYAVRLEGITVDGATLNVWIGTFSIGCTLRPVTAGRTVVVDAAGLVDANAVKVGPTGGGTAQTAGDVVAAVITNAAGTDIAADIIAVKAQTVAIEADTTVIGAAVGASISADIAAVKAQTVAIEADTDVIDDATSGLVKIASDVAAILVDTGSDGVVLPQAQADKVWGTAARTLTAGTNIALAKGTGVTGFTDIDAAGIRTAVGLAGADLDTQLAALPTDADVNAACDTAVTDGALATAAELAKVPKSDGTATWNVTALAALQTEAADALTAFAPPTKAEMDAAHALLATPAQVNAEVVDALATDTYAEPAQGAPPATASIATKIGYGYKFQRNKLEQTDTELSIYDDAGTTVDHKATVSDDGTTFTRAEIESGP